MKKVKTCSVVAACFALVGAASAALVTTDFESHATGVATAGSLNAVTTGGTWTLDVGTTVSADTNAPSIGDKAVLFDKGGSITANEQFAKLDLGSAADFTAADVTVSFVTAARRSGGGRIYRYDLLDGSGASIGYADWYVSSPSATDKTPTVSFNGAAAQTLPHYSFLNIWDADNTAQMYSFSAVLQNGSYTIDFGGISSGAIATSATSLGGIRFGTGANASGTAGGFYVDQLTVIPEPATLGLVATCGFGIMFLRRRLMM